MDRSPSSALVSWLLVPVAAVLVQSALSLPRQPYTGLVLRGDWVVEVIPESPGERAGFAPGDRLSLRQAPDDRGVFPHGPLSAAVPGRALALDRNRGEDRQLAWLVPDPLPDGERRMMAALLSVASVFVLIGGWVWSERRDPLGRTFFLLCLSFAWLLAPFRRWTWFVPALLDETVVTGIQLYLPALFVHFFALFPESRAPGRGNRWVSLAYTVASLIFLPALMLVLLSVFGRSPPSSANDLIQAAAAIWFAAGLIIALGLFVASYRRAGSVDTRRRLRVALLGTGLGAGPLAALIALRNLSPGTTVPGERWAVVLTLLVPASFAWATVVHRIFDFRVALRAVVMTLVVALAGGIAYATGEWLAATWWPEMSAGFAGGTLVFAVLAASLAGPAAPWLGSLGARMVPGDEEPTLTGWLSTEVEGARTNREDRSVLLAEACEVAARVLRLSGCAALLVDDVAIVPVEDPRPQAIRAPGPSLRQRLVQTSRPGIQRVDQAVSEPADQEALERAGVGWVLPVGVEPVRAVLLLGRRLAGTWLGRREAFDLERFAAQLAIKLENAALRRQASSRGALDRQLEEAGAIQAHLLPRQAPVYPTLDCAAATLACEPVGGDYYDFVEAPGRDLTLVVGDAAGKGVPAALLLAQVQARFRNQAQRASSPGRLLDGLNQELVRLEQPEKFVGLLCARLEVKSARLWFANAGLPPPLVRRADGSFFEILSGGLLLGVSADASYPDASLELGASDVVVVYSDGLTEARHGEEMFGTERVRGVLDRTSRRRAADILRELIAEVQAFADRPLDDLTVVVLKQLTRPARVGGPGPTLTRVGVG